MRYRILKFFTTTANLAFLWLLVRLFTGNIDLPFASACLVLSGFWLGFTYFRLGRLFQTYVSLLSRLQILAPLAFGVVLDVLAVARIWHSAVLVGAVIELIGWVGIYRLYRRNKSQYEKKGHGPVPRDAAINPPACALQPGDLILTNGRMADVAHDAVGHGELVLRDPDGNKVCFSSYMGQGVVINPILRVTKGNSRGHGFYVAIRPLKPLTDADLKRAYQIALAMKADNGAWRDRTNARHERIIGALPLPSAWKQWLIKRLYCDGYDWRGLITGVSRRHAWTCIAADLELLHRLGFKTATYGTGLFGLGTGLLDPIAPVRFLYDPNFRLVTVDDVQRAGCSDPQSLSGR